MTTTYTSGTWLVREGEEQQFVAAWEEFVRSAAGQEGSRSFWLVRDTENPRRFMSFAPWDSFEAQHAWKQTSGFSEGMARVRQHVEEFTPSVWELAAEVGS